MVIVDLYFNVDDVVPVGSVVLAEQPAPGLTIYFAGDSFEVLQVLPAPRASEPAALERLVVIVVTVSPVSGTP